MSDERISLADLKANKHGLVVKTNDKDHDLILPEYAEFKYGNGKQSYRYGRRLARLVRKHVNEREIMVTSSGYGFVPPAAHSLVSPFLSEWEGARAFKVFRRTVSNGDYASMSIKDRQKAMSAHSLAVETPIAGKTVISLDDVRVTGVHEKAMDECLMTRGAKQVIHAYIIDAFAVKDNPATEAMLNASGVKSTGELLKVANSRHFLPNARFCKRVLSMETDEMSWFLSQIPLWLRHWLVDATVQDNLGEVSSYRDGVARLHATVLGMSV